MPSYPVCGCLLVGRLARGGHPRTPPVFDLQGKQTAFCCSAWPPSADGPLGSRMGAPQLQEDLTDPMLTTVGQGSGLWTCGKSNTCKKQVGRQKTRKDDSWLPVSGRSATKQRTEPQVRSGVLFQSSARYSVLPEGQESFLHLRISLKSWCDAGWANLATKGQRVNI